MENQEVQLKNEALQLKQEVATLTVKNQEQYNRASGLLVMVKGRIKQINDWFSPLVAAAHNAHKALKDRQNETLAPAMEAEGIIKRQMQAYIIEQDRIQAEAQRRLDDEASRKQRELEEKARLAREAGKDAKADKYEQKAQEVIAPIVAPSVQTTVKTDSGATSIKRHTEVTIIDPMEIIKSIASGAPGSVPITVIEISESKLVKWIDANGIKTCAGLQIKLNVPGLAGRAK